jgi:hypothetical protein
VQNIFSWSHFLHSWYIFQPGHGASGEEAECGGERCGAGGGAEGDVEDCSVGIGVEDSGVGDGVGNGSIKDGVRLLVEMMIQAGELGIMA